MDNQESPPTGQGAGCEEVGCNHSIPGIEIFLNAKVNLPGIPEELRTVVQWLCWRPVYRNGKWTKVPINAKNGQFAKTDDPSTWSTFDQATSYYKKHPWNGKGNGVCGVGFVFTSEDPYFGIDLDGCFSSVGGEITDVACDVVCSLDSYTEYSPSGTGAHIIAKGALPGGERRKNSSLKIEVYDRGRYFTFTGNIFEGQSEIKDRQPELDSFMAQYIQVAEEKKNTSKTFDANVSSPQNLPPLPWDSPTGQGVVLGLGDQDILKRAFCSQNGPKIKALYDGSGPGEDESAGDMALANHLVFWFGKDEARIDSVFRQSGRFRPKWDEKHYADGRTYGQGTIQKAINDIRGETYPEGCASRNHDKSNAQVISMDDSALKKRAQNILDAQAPCDIFDPQFLPPIVGDYINEICKTTQADTITVAASVYATLSALIKKRIFIPEGQYFQRLYPNLWMLTISMSGSFKTTALRKGAQLAWEVEKSIREHVNSLQDALAEAEKIKNDKDRKEREIEIRKDIMEAEVQSPILPNRVTGEALLESLSCGAAGCIFSSEYGDWLETLERTHNMGLKALFTDLYDCPPQYSYKTRTKGHLVVIEPFISICGVSTLDWITKNINPKDVASGFFARYLLFYPPPRDEIPPALPLYVEKDYTIENDIKERIKKIPTSQAMRLSVDATELFHSIHRGMHEGLHAEGDVHRAILGPYLKRWSPYILKLAMLNQVMINPSEAKISAVSMAGLIEPPMSGLMEPAGSCDLRA